MKSIKEFLSKKSVGYYIFLASALCGLISGIVWTVRDGDVLTTYNSTILILALAGFVTSLVVLYKDFVPLEIAPFILYFASLVVFADDEINFIGNVITGIDGNVFDGAFIVGFVLSILAVILGIVATIMGLEKEAPKTKSVKAN